MNLTNEISNRKGINVSILFLSAFITFICFTPSHFFLISAGVDNSWAFGINWNFANDFPSEVFFTYGPLGFLFHALPVGHNLRFALGFSLLMSLFFFVLLYEIIVKNSNIRNMKIAVVVSLLYLSSNAFSYLENFNHYFLFCALLSLLVAWRINKKFFFIFDFLFVLSFFMKFSEFIVLFSALCIFIFVMLFDKPDIKIFFAIHIFCDFILLPVVHIIFFNHSLDSFLRYTYGSFQQADGFSYAMSIDAGFDCYMPFIFLIVLAYTSACIISFFTNKKNLYLLLIFLGPLFFFYKHGFVRADEHIDMAFRGFLLIIALLLLFFDFSSFKKKSFEKYSVYGLAFATLLCFIYTGSSLFNFVEVIKLKTLDFPKNICSVWKQKKGNLVKLPEEILDAVGNDSVAIYPWEISYVASNALNYKQMPVLQIYSAYTPWLDKKTSDFYSDDNAPEYIILDTLTIDNRWPFIEVPKTWAAIKQNYKVCLFCGGHLLLKKDKKTYSSPNFVYEWVQKKFEPIKIEENVNQLRINAELSFLGHFAKFLWKIPEVNMTVSYKDGRIETHRVLLDMLSSAFCASSINNFDADSVIDTLNYGGELSKVKEISFSGRGLRFYKKEISVSAYFEDCVNREAEPDNYILYAQKTELPDYEIVEKDFHYSVDDEYITNSVISLRGWAFNDAEKCDIYIGRDKEFFMAKKVSRPDVRNVFPIANEMCGFDIKMRGVYTGGGYTIYLVSHEKQEIYVAPRIKEQDL